MVLSEWKESTINSPGNAQIFGGFDFNRISRLLNGDADVGQVEIDSDIALLPDRLKLRSTANVNDVTLNANPAQASNITVSFPVLTVNGTIVIQDLVQTLTNKTFNISDNSLTMNSANTGDIMYYDSTAGKMIRLARGTANQSLLMNATGDGLMWGSGGGGGGSWNPNLAETITNKTISLANNTVTDTSIATGDIAKATAAGKFLRFARGAVNTVLQCSSTDLQYGLIGDSNINAHTTSKITTTSKTLLNSALIYNDQNNFLGAFYYDIAQITPPSAPTSGRRRMFADSSTGGQLSIVKSDGTVISLETSAWNPSLSETLTNKKIDAVSNTLDHVSVAPGVKKVGYWHAISTLGGTGLFNGFLQMPNGTATFNRSSSLGTYQTLTTGASNTNTCCIKTIDSYTARALNPTFKAKFRVPTASGCRIGLGLISDISFDQRNSDWLASNSGAAFVYGTGRQDEASLYFTCCDGSSSSFYSSALATVVANTVYTVELKFDNTNNKISWSFNGGAFTDVTTKVPASSTLLAAAWGVQTTTGSSRTLDTFYTETTSDK